MPYNRAIASARCALALVMAACAAGAATVGGVTLAPTVQLAGRTLELASCGVRDTMWIDHYAAGLYVPSDAGPRAVRDPGRAKAVRMKIIDARYLPDNIPQQWRTALDRELAKEPMVRVRHAYDGLADGDVVTFTYVPDEGTAMQVNGRVVLRTDGHAVIESILDAWAERDPIGDKLHRLSLEHPC